jgi:hypothetical protein
MLKFLLLANLGMTIIKARITANLAEKEVPENVENLFNHLQTDRIVNMTEIQVDDHRQEENGLQDLILDLLLDLDRKLNQICKQL